ncbi:MAG: methionine--tRNA ligase subunit beta, partial [Desulfobacterales bacterium]|nr:methionine--tRNA ligase subunit beta [Desulfobacterales bacterium]
LIYPVMPATAQTMQSHLGLDPRAPFYRLTALAQWGGLPSGGRLPKGVMLFPRIETTPEESPRSEPLADTATLSDLKPQITYEDFSRLDLRVATVVGAEAVPRAKKLLKLEIDLGERREIVAGIATSYAPEALVGKQIIVVANLKPTRLMGVLSQGMLIAAVDESESVLAVLDKQVKPGTPLR